MSDFDLIVVGSGPAGSSAATRALSLGLRVAVVDKARFPRDKLCGGLFTGRSQKALRHIFGLEVTPELFLRTTHMRFLADGKVLADIPDAPDVHLTMRREFDAHLHAQALAAGAQAFLGQPITALLPNSITLRDGTELSFKVLIGADGVNSFVARSLFGRPFDPDKIGFGLEIESPLQKTRDNAVEVDFNAARWGYGWSFPKQKSVTIGVGGIKSKNEDMKARMAQYVALTKSDNSLPYKGQYLPFGDYKKTPGRDNIILAGDAAGLVDPITGEGIALAMESGAMAADAAHNALQNGTPEKALHIYRENLRPIHRSLDHARLWRMIMFPEATHPYFVKAFSQRNELQMKYLQLLAGEIDYADLRGALTRRLPKLLWRLAKHRLFLQNPQPK